jgi:hypothetical protein
MMIYKNRSTLGFSGYPRRRDLLQEVSKVVRGLDGCDPLISSHP